MKTYTIKYETYSGDCRVETVTAFDERSAISQLVNCRIVYWCEEQKFAHIGDGSSMHDLQLFRLSLLKP